MWLELRVCQRVRGFVVSERISNDRVAFARWVSSLMRILPYVRSVVGCATLKR
jgi:hypothetical protein